MREAESSSPISIDLSAFAVKLLHVQKLVGDGYGSASTPQVVGTHSPASPSNSASAKSLACAGVAARDPHEMQRRGASLVLSELHAVDTAARAVGGSGSSKEDYHSWPHYGKSIHR